MIVLSVELATRKGGPPAEALRNPLCPIKSLVGSRESSNELMRDDYESPCQRQMVVPGESTP